MSRTFVRTAAPTLNAPFIGSHLASLSTGFQKSSYVDYDRALTPQGGILITYKDLDLRFRHTVWRAFAWVAFTGFEAWLLLGHSPLQRGWINAVCLLLMAIINGFIVAKPVEVYRTVEIRPDCMIIADVEVFWLQMMECGLPAFRTDEDGDQVLSGIYGTRFVDFLTARKFDEQDRMPEVFAAHLQEAMQQLWAPALALGRVSRGSPPGQGW
jgi:hypothetical protein